MKSGLISWLVCISSVCLTITIVLGCSSRKYVGMDATDCARELNSFLCEEFKREYDGDFDSIKYDIRFFVGLYLQENGNVDSIKVLISNLNSFNINEDRIVNKLRKKKYTCAAYVFYRSEIKPWRITYRFSPKWILINKKSAHLTE